MLVMLQSSCLSDVTCFCRLFVGVAIYLAWRLLFPPPGLGQLSSLVAFSITASCRCAGTAVPQNAKSVWLLVLLAALVAVIRNCHLGVKTVSDSIPGIMTGLLKKK